MITGDIETTEKVEYEDLLKNYYEKMKIIEEQDKEIERLNKLISQREKKWEKWTTEKQILSSKMSDYLCKYQNIKREYTKQIKISTDRKNEIERLNNIINELFEYLKENSKQPELFESDRYYENVLDKLQELKGENNE